MQGTSALQSGDVGGWITASLCWSTLALLGLRGCSWLSLRKEGVHAEFGGKKNKQKNIGISTGAFCMCQSRKMSPEASFNSLTYILFSL